MDNNGDLNTLPPPPGQPKDGFASTLRRGGRRSVPMSEQNESPLRSRAASDEDYYRPTKRARQACVNCRRKKVRCSGDRPACTYCARLCQKCSYSDGSQLQPRVSGAVSLYASDNSTMSAVVGGAAECKSEPIDLHSLARQLASLQSSIQSLTSRMDRDNVPRAGSKFDKFGPEELEREATVPDRALLSAADLYFRYCHNQPYSIFHEASFRERLAAGTVPRHLCLALLASGRRFSALGRLHPLDAERISAYTEQAWKSVFLMSPAVAEQDAAVSLVQTILLLCVIDYSDGRCAAAWIKLGFGIRIAQCYRLNMEPPSGLNPAQREERRRVFWSVYLLDRLVSCGRDRPPAIQEDDCKLQLPSNEQCFREGSEHPTSTLDLLVGDAPIVTSLPAQSHFALLILMATTLNHVVQYTLREDKNHRHVVPWSSTSRYAALESTLLRLELNYGMNQPLEAVLTGASLPDGAVDPQIAGLLLYARALFHLSGCLLHHPFLLQQRISLTASRVPPDFLNRVWTSSKRHANALSMLQDVRRVGCVTVSCFRGYCAMVAGSIHSLFAGGGVEVERQASLQQYNTCLALLKDLSHYWKSSARMATRLERLHKNCVRYRQILDFHNDINVLPKLTALWESIDNWATPTRSPSPVPQQEGHVEGVVNQNQYGSLADFFDYSNFDLWEDSVGYQNMALETGFHGMNNPYLSVEAGWF